MPVVDILPSPLYIEECPFHSQVKRLFLEEIERQEGTSITNPSSESLTHIDHYSVLGNDSFARFRTWVEGQAEIYVKDVLGRYLPEGMLITDSWLNVCNEEGHQTPHFHANSIVSALYYINFDEEKHSPTFFTRPQLGQNYPHYPALQMPYCKNTRYNQLDQVKGREGALFMWEASVVHGFKTNTHPNRVTLAMNLMPTVISNGDYGWKVTPLNENERKKHVTEFREGRLWDTPDWY